MEGPHLRRSPRTALCCATELRAGKKAIRLEQAVGNLSAGGLFVNAHELPVNTAVHIKMEAAPFRASLQDEPAFEAEGVVRFCEAGGVGIEFTGITEANRRRLAELIAEFTQREVLAS